MFDLSSWLSWLWVVFQVAASLGFVIFVHELGHFAVAKWCGVRCDKFFVGFDIAGYKISKKWGETEYGIGILPLGGYVKMFGQDDNVANIEEEIRQSEALANSPDAVEIVGPSGQKHWVHRRSYLAKNVPQRMAIISAGVIMNVIFGLLFAILAFGIGVPEQPCIVSNTVPGGTAWRAGLRTGDRITKLGEIENPSYRQLNENVLLGDSKTGIEVTVERDGSEPRNLTLIPDRVGKLQRIGISSPNAIRLPVEKQEDLVSKTGPASEATGAGFEHGDLIVAANGVEVSSYAELVEELLKAKSEPMTYTLLRGGKPPESNPYGPLSGGERVETTVGPNAMERLGIVPKLGPITALQEGSPAIEAGLKVGDLLVAVNDIPLGAASDGQESWDPVLLDDRLHAIARRAESATLTISRGTETLELEVTPRLLSWSELLLDKNTPLPITSLGVTCELIAEVQAVVANSPAAEADVQPGDRVTKVKLTSSDPEDALAKEPVEFELGEDKRSWPMLLQSIQDKSEDFLVELTLDKGGKEQVIKLQPTSVQDAFTHVRGIRLTPLKQLRIATNFQEQCSLGWDETQRALGTVFSFLGKLTSQEIPVTALGGPVTIAKVAGYSAFESFGSLLIVLTMLSANLAVLNFMPIPVLDGGHMVFLAWEGITGRPPNEKLVTILSFMGFVMLVSLMLFVTLLDVGLIPRGL